MLSLMLMLASAALGVVLIIVMGVIFYEVVLMRRETGLDARDTTRSTDWTQSDG